MTTTPPASDREALSALFDGELVGDAARFALKRLDHDEDWRATCGRWQCVGDALRSRTTALPATFPPRVRAALHADAPQGSRTAYATARAGGLRWGSVALAASAAVVAFFLARSPLGGPDVAEPEHVAAAGAMSAPASAASSAQAPAIPAAGLESAAAVAALARPAQRNRNLQRDRAATDRVISSVLAASQITAEAGPVSQPVADETAVRADTVADRAISPFDQAATDAAAVRPWPRAVLPQYDRGGTLAADHGRAPSFYPFVPATQESPAADDAPGEQSDPANPQSNRQSPPPPSP